MKSLLCLGIATIAGVLTWNAGQEAVGQTLAVYTCLFMALSGVVLSSPIDSGLGRSRGKGVGGALGQAVPPLVALTAFTV